MISLARWIADAATGNNNVSSYLAQFGIVGFAVITFAVVIRYLFNRLEEQTVQRINDLQRQSDQRMDELRHGHDIAIRAKDSQLSSLQEDKRLLQRSNEEAVTFMRDKLVPALAESARITAEYVNELKRRGAS